WIRAPGPSTSLATAIVAARSSRSASGTPRILVSGWARKFCTMTSWMPRYSRATPRIAKIESARSATVSPMPIRMPVVNGTLLRPASSSTRSLTAGSLSGLPKCGPPRRVEMRQQAGLLEHPDRHRPDVGQRVVVAVRVQPLPGLRPPVLRPVAEREQRLLAAERRSPGRDLDDLVRRQVGAV